MTMKMIEVLYAEISLSCCALIALIIIRICRSLRRDVRTRAYIKALSGFILFLFFDTVWGVFRAVDVPMGSFVEYLLEYLYLGFLLVTSANLFCFMKKLVTDDGRQEKIFLSILPAVVGVLILSFNLVEDGSVFRVVDGNLLEFGLLYYLLWIPIYLYLFAGFFLVIRYLRKDEDLARKERDLLALISLLMLVIATIADEFLVYVPTLSMALTICFLFAYLDEQSSSIFMDALTKLNNRRQFNRYLDTRIKEKRAPGKNLYLVIVDIDFFKEINDNFGHIEGDCALVRTADCLRACVEGLDGKTMICRYGGDEFAIVTEVSGRDDVENYCRSVQKMLLETGKTSPYRLEISYGIAMLTEETSGISDLLKTADRAMYAVKKIHHNRRA
uniref:GGDEF domain-containing protein n=1 Tax=Eubacterium cellulosolvens TaxID=29322 RepID=UPI000482CDC5|nr:GGDEF domain-containing protein [[Eubacterium] cellulosolvens]